MNFGGNASVGSRLGSKGSRQVSRSNSKIRRSSTGFFSAAHQDLLDTVDGILEGTMPVKAATAHIRRCEKQLEDGAGTVAPEAIDSAVEILTECLRRRLREAAETAILVGRSHVTQEDVADVGRALLNAKESGFLDEDLDLHEFERLSRNLDVRWLVEKEVDPRDSAQARKCVNFLKRHLDAPAADVHVMLTDYTLAEVSQTLLWMMVASEKACDAVIKLGIVDTAAEMVLGPPNVHDAEERPMAETPELQGRLCHIIAGVAVRACDDEDKKKRTGNVAKLFAGGLLKGLAAGGGTHSAEGDKAVKLLLHIMKDKLEINEHGGVWAAVRALHLVAQRETGAKKILMAEGLPMIRKAYAYYRSLRVLPPRQPRQPPEGPRISYEKPTLLHSPTAPALWRKPPGVMESLRKQEELANPQKTIVRRTLLDMVGSDGTPNADAPAFSLLGLLKEDEVEPLAYLRVTDRNVMTLKLHYLERSVVSASAKMKAPFARSKSSVRRSPSIDADNSAGGTDMAQTAETPSFQRSMTKLDEGRPGSQGAISRKSTFLDAGRGTFASLDDGTQSNAMRRGFSQSNAQARMSFVG